MTYCGTIIAVERVRRYAKSNWEIATSWRESTSGG